MNPIRLPPEPRVLVVALRRLGDVLLTTPLIRSIKRAYPGAAIEALVFAGTEGILSGNPDLAGVLTMPERQSPRDACALLWRIWRRYDLALTTQTGDRPTFFAWLGGRQSAGPLDANRLSASLKRLALSRSYTSDRRQHRIVDLLRMTERLGIPASAEVVCPQGSVRTGLLPAQPYAVVHAAPKYRYKQWTPDGWRKLAAALRQRGLPTVAIGAATDRAYLDAVWRDAGVTRLDGALSWPELTALIGGARVFIGPDTAVTHLAAATGTPTVALYGPTDPRIWGPARSSNVAMSGWCKIRCRVCPASWRVASGGSTATANALMNLPWSKSRWPSIARSRCGRRLKSIFRKSGRRFSEENATKSIKLERCQSAPGPVRQSLRPAA
jgi:heptosyltransferase-3